MSSIDELKYKFNNLDVFGKIIAINVVVFVLGFILSKLFRLDVMDYFVLPSDFMDFIVQPWSLISYGFFHAGFLHLLFNMLLLYYLARTATNLFRVKMVLNVYFLGIIFGGLAYLVFANVIPTDFFGVRGVLLGASAGVSALLMFVAAYMPDSQIRLFNSFNVKWKHIAMVFLGFDVLRLLLGFNRGGYVSHLGGYFLGYIYARNLLKGKDIGAGFESIMDSFVSWFKPKSNLKTVHRKQRKSTYSSKSKNQSSAVDKQKRIDSILDKISKSGYESLTAEEKEFLFKVGKE